MDRRLLKVFGILLLYNNRSRGRYFGLLCLPLRTSITINHKNKSSKEK
jgi:hypothetical protein